MPADRPDALDRVAVLRSDRRWWGDLLFAAVLAGALLPVSATLIEAGTVGATWTAALWSALVVMHAAVLFRRAFPVPTFLVLALAEVLLAMGPSLENADEIGAAYPAILLPSSVTYLVGAYTVSASGPRPWPMLSLLTGVAGALLVTVRTARSPDAADLLGADGIGELIFVGGALLATVVAAWALGRYRRMRDDELVALAERARRAEADREQRDRQAAMDERARIARELHDVVAHSLSVMVRQADGGRYVSAADPAAASAALQTIAATGREALTDMRTLLGVLDAASPPETGPQPTVDDIADLVERLRAAGQPVRLRIVGDPQPMNRAAHLAAYRLVQEALTNVVKHAGPEVEAEVDLVWRPDSLRLTVTDRGTPPRATTGSPPGGRGLAGMRERLHLVGGRLGVGPADSAGFAVVAEIPTASAMSTSAGSDGGQR